VAWAGAAAFATPAWAADADTTTGSLTEITVTAQKVNTKLQKTPIAITALSPEQMANANIRSIQDLDKQIPGMTATNAGPYPMNVTIRGVGYDGVQNNSAQPGVAFVENGAYVASPVALTAGFIDLGQLEVLRGPQGTVNGQNADGGAINVTTIAPALGQLTGAAEASYGSYNYNRERAVINLPVGDTFALRAAFQHDAHDGWYKAPNQPAAGGNVGSQNSYTGRISALWQPTDRFSLNLWAEFFNNDRMAWPFATCTTRPPISARPATTTPPRRPCAAASWPAPPPMTWALRRSSRSPASSMSRCRPPIRATWSTVRSPSRSMATRTRNRSS
jgi:iron complex outermembrane receptor protein